MAPSALRISPSTRRVFSRSVTICWCARSGNGGDQRLGSAAACTSSAFCAARHDPIASSENAASSAARARHRAQSVPTVASYTVSAALFAANTVSPAARRAASCANTG